MSTEMNPYGLYDNVDELEEIYDSFRRLIDLAAKQHLYEAVAAFEESAGQAAGRIRELLHL